MLEGESASPVTIVLYYEPPIVQVMSATNDEIGERRYL